MDKKILIVDDEIHIRELLQDVFSRKGGYTVITASSGEEAVAIIRREDPDVVFLDVRMRGMDGIETLKKARAGGFRKKVFILTALDDPETKKKAMENGASGVLTKQLDLITFLKVGEEAAGRQGNRILIADDNVQICALLNDFLLKKRFIPIIAISGEEALEKVKQEKPRAVLLDVKMPGIDGLMVLKRIKEIDPAIHVIMITGIGDEAIAKEAMHAGAFDYIVKPVDLGYLEKCLLVTAISG
jgi:two-component system, response regulator, stage 0 sporulation protein F